MFRVLYHRFSNGTNILKILWDFREKHRIPGRGRLPQKEERQMGREERGLRRRKRVTEKERIQMEEKFHDLLTPILGYAEFLQIQLGPENELSQDAHEIELAAGQLQALLQELLSPLQPGEGKNQAGHSVGQGTLPSEGRRQGPERADAAKQQRPHPHPTR